MWVFHLIREEPTLPVLFSNQKSKYLVNIWSLGFWSPLLKWSGISFVKPENRINRVAKTCKLFKQCPKLYPKKELKNHLCISFYQYNDTLLLRKFANNHDCAQTLTSYTVFFYTATFFFLQDMKNQLKVDFTVGTKGQ